MICVGIYAVLIQGISFSGNILTALWGVMGYTVLLCFTLFKTGTLVQGKNGLTKTKYLTFGKGGP